MFSEPDVEKRQKLEKAAVRSVAQRIAMRTGSTKTAPVGRPASPSAPRSIFKAKTTSEAPSTAAERQTAVRTLPPMGGNRAASEIVTAQRHAPQQTPPVANRGLGASSDRIQIPVSNGRMSLNPTAALVFGSHQEVLEYSSAGTLSFQELVVGATRQGEVIFHVPAAWNFPPAGNRPAEAALVGTALAHVRVPFSIAVDKDKPDQLVITWQSPRTIAMDSEGGGANLSGAPVTTDPTPNGGAATITPTVQFQEQLSHAVTRAGDTVTFTGGITTPLIGASESITKDVGAGDTQGHQEQTQVNVTDSISMSFTANVVLPKPEQVQTSAQLEVRFAVNSDSTTSGGEEEKITQWYQTLDKKVRDSIESGKTQIALLGKASTTGSFEHNRKLAERRVARVKEILADLAGSDAKFHTQALGRSQPHHQGEDPEERVVLITLGEDRPATVVTDEAPPEKLSDKKPGY